MITILTTQAAGMSQRAVSAHAHQSSNSSVPYVLSFTVGQRVLLRNSSSPGRSDHVGGEVVLL